METYVWGLYMTVSTTMFCLCGRSYILPESASLMSSTIILLWGHINWDISWTKLISSILVKTTKTDIIKMTYSGKKAEHGGRSRPVSEVTLKCCSFSTWEIKRNVQAVLSLIFMESFAEWKPENVFLSVWETSISCSHNSHRQAAMRPHAWS